MQSFKNYCEFDECCGKLKGTEFPKHAKFIFDFVSYVVGHTF